MFMVYVPDLSRPGKPKIGLLGPLGLCELVKFLYKFFMKRHILVCFLHYHFSSVFCTLRCIPEQEVGVAIPGDMITGRPVVEGVVLPGESLISGRKEKRVVLADLDDKIV